MRLQIIVPNITDEWNGIILHEFKKWADVDTEIFVTNIRKGPESIESEYDEENAAPFVLEEVKRAEIEGMDGVLLFCFGDIAIHAAREAVHIPVVGLGESSQLLATLLGDHYAILSTISNAIPRLRRKSKAMGLEDKLMLVKAINIPVLNKDKVIEENALLKEGQLAVEKGADVIVLGCGTYFGVEKKMSECLKVPVINCALAGLKMIELLVKLQLSHSKQAFPNPPEKKRIL